MVPFRGRFLEGKEHKIPYLTSYKSESIDPVTGKYHGYRHAGGVMRHLKKRARQTNKALIADALLEFEDQTPCNWCGSDDCDNPIACRQEEENCHDFDQWVYDNWEREFHEEYIEEEDDDPYFLDPYLDDYNLDWKY
jgi:excinuclease UvrABC ATPase subunit